MLDLESRQVNGRDRRVDSSSHSHPALVELLHLDHSFILLRDEVGLHVLSDAHEVQIWLILSSALGRAVLLLFDHNLVGYLEQHLSWNLVFQVFKVVYDHFLGVLFEEQVDEAWLDPV